MPKSVLSSIVGVLVVIVLVQSILLLRRSTTSPPVSAAPNSTFPAQTTFDRNSVYQQGMKLYAQQGAEAGQRFFQQQFDETGEDLYFFALAWIEYQQREYAQAEKRVEYLLASPSDGVVQANALHLKGYLLYSHQEMDNAISFFRQAESINLELGHSSVVFHNRIGIALALTFQEQYEEARKIMNHAYDAAMNGGRPENLSQFYSLRGIVDHGLGNNVGARNFERLCLKNLEELGNDSQQVYSLLRLGAYEVQLGEIDNAAATTAAAKQLIDRLEMEIPIEYLVNQFVIHKCQGTQQPLDYEALQEQIATRGTPYHQKLYQHLNDWECHSSKEPEIHD